MSTRIYRVESAGRTVALVRAATPSQALRYHTHGCFAVAVASQDDLVSALGAGMKVEVAGEPPVLTQVIDDGHDGSEQ